MRPQKLPGFEDLVFEEARLKRVLEANLAALFLSWGYQEVVTPTLELYETMQLGGFNGEERLFKLIDREGRILALRPDMTTPISRLVATRLAGAPRPLKLFYLANLFRYGRAESGQTSEFFQAGVELVGDGGWLADAEVVILAVEALHRAGVRDLELGIGQIEFLEGLIRQLGLGSEERSQIKVALQSRDFVRLDRLVADLNLGSDDRNLLDEILHFRGGLEDFSGLAVLVRDEPAREALDRLEKLVVQLGEYGLGEGAYLDFGLVRDLNYYTGTVFEVYAGGMGVPVCGGGRYDGLLGRFGKPEPATGFAVNLSALLGILAGDQRRGEGGQVIEYLVVSLPGGEAGALRLARELREAGRAVLVESAPDDNSVAESSAARPIPNVIAVDAAGRKRILSGSY